VVESVSDGVFIAGEDAKYVFLSSSYERLIGIRREEWVRGRAAVAIHPDDRRAVIDGISRAIGGGRCGCRARVRIASGRYIDISLRFSPFSWKGRRLALAVVHCTNHD
jgi:PAS domain S-box-containing protein